MLPENAVVATAEFGMVPFYTGADRYYVYIEADMVASITFNASNGKWLAVSDPDQVEYDSPIMAAFADANLSNPGDWQ